MRAVHPLLVLVAFTVAAVVTYAVVLGLLTAASACRGAKWLDDEPDAEGGPVDRDAVMLTTRPTDPGRGSHAP